MNVRHLKHSEVAGVLEQLVRRQGGKCAMCHHSFTRKDPACLDHDHDTGFIRGACHRSCNGVEGKIKALARRCHAGVGAVDFMKTLGEYLRKHEKPQLAALHPEHKTPEQLREARNKKAREARARKKAQQ